MFQAIKSTFGWRKKKQVKTKITLGICAMDRKAKSKPMREILERLPEEYFDIVVFGDDVILNKPIEQWPVVEALISFYSSKFPTEKAISYVKFRNPFIFNDLEMEAVMKDRRKVYSLLRSQNIEVPVHIFLNREDPSIENVIEEYDEFVIINGVQINKPLVEKPVDAEDHNIYIYYPMSAGGGSKRLFRKVKDRSSEFYPHVNELRMEGSYIYEEFVHTQGTDVKVYTVGPDYGHAEARKSPVVDGKVNRDSLGYEVRYPVILTPIEKDMARRIVLAFRQTVCGFDILRVQGKSYVCDVNGFSFVKNSRKYYDDASQILMEILLNALRPEIQATLSTRAPLLLQRERASTHNGSSNQLRRPSFSSGEPNDQLSVTSEDVGRSPSPSVSQYGVGSDNYSVNSDNTTLSTKKSRYPIDQEELRCIIAVIRHGDRTPKQKMKVKVAEPKYLEYYHSYTKSPYKDLKVKSKSALVKFLDITREIITSGNVLKDDPILRKLRQIKDVLERWEISGINRKLQMKPQKWTVDPNSEEAETAINIEATELLVILKWGGDLTPLGRSQAEQVGALFRHNLYPDTEGGGVLRLHSTYRHDLKIKASDEGRVMKTAAAFTKGLLELEGQLTPILASLVTVEEKNRQMLDRGGNNEVRDDMDHCKHHLNKLQVDQEMTPELVDLIAPGAPPATVRAMMNLKNPLKTLWRIYELIEGLCTQLDEICKDYSDYSESPSPAPLDFDLSYASTVQPSPSREGTLTFLSKTDSMSTEASPTREVLTRRHNHRSNDETSLTTAKEVKEGEEMSNQIHEAAELLSSSWPSIQDFPLTSSLPDKQKSVESDVISTNTGHTSNGGNISTTTTMTAAATTTTTTLTRPTSESFSVPPLIERPVELELKSVDDGLYLNETFFLISDRWQKLYKDFYIASTNMFDLTKVPDVYDMIRYDCLHNHHLRLDGMEELFQLTQNFENAVVPQEYGIDRDEKRLIGSKMCGALLEKIKRDLQVVNSDQRHEMVYSLDHSHAADLAINSLGRLVRTRLYFTSESHLHTLLNVLRYPADGTPCAFSTEGLKCLDDIGELSYLTQVIIRLFEDRVDPSKFRCELSLSPGAISNPLTDKNGEIAPCVLLNKSISYDDLMACLSCAIDAGKCHDEDNSSSPEKTSEEHLKDIHSMEEESQVSLADPSITNPDDLPHSDKTQRSSEKSLNYDRSDDKSNSGHSTPAHSMKRNTSVTVVQNSNFENNDRWEMSSSNNANTHSLKKRDKGNKMTSKRGDYVMREVGGTTTTSKPTMALKTLQRSQSPAPPIPTATNPTNPSSGMYTAIGIAERVNP